MNSFAFVEPTMDPVYEELYSSCKSAEDLDAYNVLVDKLLADRVEIRQMNPLLICLLVERQKNNELKRLLSIPNVLNLARDLIFPWQTTLCEYIALNGWCLDVLEYMLEELRYKIQEHERPLMFACLVGNLDVAQYLLAGGADPNYSLPYSTRFMLSQLSKKVPEYIFYIRNPAPLHMVSMQYGDCTQRMAIFDHLIANGADPLSPRSYLEDSVPPPLVHNPREPESAIEIDVFYLYLPIQVAACCGNATNLLKLLDHSGTDQLFAGHDDRNLTPLQLAVWSDSLDAVRAIVEYPTLTHVQLSKLLSNLDYRTPSRELAAYLEQL